MTVHRPWYTFDVYRFRPFIVANPNRPLAAWCRAWEAVGRQARARALRARPEGPASEGPLPAESPLWDVSLRDVDRGRWPRPWREWVPHWLSVDDPSDAKGWICVEFPSVVCVERVRDTGYCQLSLTVLSFFRAGWIRRKPWSSSSPFGTG